MDKIVKFRYIKVFKMKYLKNIVGFAFIILFLSVFILVISLKNLNTISRLLLLLVLQSSILIINMLIRPLLEKKIKK